jgi:Tfp pilus assembly protein PilF
VTERKNVLSATFYLLAMGAGLTAFGLEGRADDPEPRADSPGFSRQYLPMFALFLLALLSKSVTCTLPAVLLLFAWWKRGKVSWRRLALAAPMLAVGLAMGMNTAALERDHVGARGPAWAFTPVQRVLIASRAVWLYVGKILWPARLSFVYPRWPIDSHQNWQWIYPLGIAVMVVTLWLLRGRLGRGPLTASLYFLGTLAPALGFVNIFPMRYTFVADHYQYLASLGVIVLVCSAVDAGAIAWRRVGPAGMNAIAATIWVALGLATFARAGVYRDQTTLWADTLAKNPDSWMVRENLGQAREAAGDLAAAGKEYAGAVEADPAIAETHWKLGVFLLSRGNAAGAVPELARAVRLEPGWPQAWEYLGRADEALGEDDEAGANYSHAVALRPGDGVMRYELGRLLAKVGRDEAAARQLSAAANLLPGRADVWIDLGDVLLRTGDPGAAGKCFESALALDRASSAARQGLARATAAVKGG